MSAAVGIKPVVDRLPEDDRIAPYAATMLEVKHGGILG